MKRIISCVLSLVLLVSISATPILAATKATQEPLKITERADRSNEKYTLEDLAAMRLAVYGILEEKFRSKQEETNAPISRPEAVKLSGPAQQALAYLFRQRSIRCEMTKPRKIFSKGRKNSELEK